MSYVVLNATDDPRASILAIRAFALAGRWGDRLTLHGCRARYGKLKRWTRALRIDDVVSFDECAPSSMLDYSAHDVVIMTGRVSSAGPLPTVALEAGLHIIVLDRSLVTPKLFDRDLPGVYVPGNDLHQLIRAMLKLRTV